MFKNLVVILISSVLINNYVLNRFLGICPFLGVSKKLNQATGMGISVTLVMLIASAVTWPIQNFVLNAFGLGYLQTIIFILVIATLVQLIEIVLKKFIPSLHKSLGVYLPLITTNCAVLGVAELVIDTPQMMSLLGISSMNMGYAVLYGLFAGLGFTLSIVIMSGLREKISRLTINKHLKGFPIAMITASFIAMAFYVFALI